MFPVLAIFQRPLPRRTVLLPAVVALLGSGILLLIWGLAPPPAGSDLIGAAGEFPSVQSTKR